MAIDWSLAQTQPNILGNALQGYQAGQEARRVTQRRNALAAYAQNPETGLQGVIAADPEFGIQLQQRQQQLGQQNIANKRQVREDARTEEDRQRARAAQFYTGILELPEPQRRAAALQNVTTLGLEGPQLERALATLSDPNTRWDDASVAMYARNAGGNPYEGARVVGRGDIVQMPNGREIGRGLPPAPLYQVVGPDQEAVLVNGAEIAAWNQQSPQGGGAPPQASFGGPSGAGMAAPPTPTAGTGAGSGVGVPGGGSPPGVAAPGRPAPGNVASVFATPEDRRAAAIFVHGESGHGPGEDAAILSALINTASAAGMTASQYLRARPSYSAAYTRGNGATRNFNPDGPQGQRYGQLIDSIVSGQTPLLPYTNFEGTAFPVRSFERNPVTIGRTRFSDLSGGGGQRPAPQATPPPVANQTAPQGGAPGNIRGPQGDRWVDEPGGGQRNTRTGQTRDVPDPVRQGRPPTPEERARGIDYIAPTGEPHYAPAGTVGGRRPASVDRELRDFRTAATTARHAAELAAEFLTLNRQRTTGVGRSLMGPLNVMDPTVRRMESITNELTPLMRQGLPGAASDRDIEMFRGATVGVGNPGETNRRTAEAAMAAARRVQAHAQFMEWYASTNGNLDGAQEQWDDYADANPLFQAGPNGALTVPRQQPWRQYFGIAAAPRGGPRRAAGQPAPAPAPRATAPQRPARTPPPPRPGTVRNGYRFTGGDPASPSSWQRVR